MRVQSCVQLRRCVRTLVRVNRTLVGTDVIGDISYLGNSKRTLAVLLFHSIFDVEYFPG